MATITAVHSKNKKSSTEAPDEATKAAEIYRKDCGGIYYLCYHCGIQLSGISDTLDHIDQHYRKDMQTKNPSSMDIVDEDSEQLDNVTEEVVNPSQLEQIFIDCSKSVMALNDEPPCFQTNVSAIYTVVVPIRQTLTKPKENHSEIDGLHVKHCHDPEPMKCTPCGRQFVSTQLLKDHVSAVHANVDANKNSEQQIDENNSRTILSQYNTFLCILCNRTFNGTLNLMQHTFGHFNVKNFSCTQCPAKYRRMATLNDHMEKKHASNVDEVHIFNIQCRFCSEKVENLFEFVTHTFTNHLDEGDKNNCDLDSIFHYDCRFCFRNFTSWNDAHRHLDVHAKDELPPSAITTTTVRCFSERAKSVLYRSELLYNCIGCEKTLRGSFEARNHWITEHKSVVKKEIVQNPMPINNRTVEKEFQKCHDCDDVFCTKFDLMKHRLKHFKVQPYSCTVCAKRFSVGKNVPVHMTKVHNLKPDDQFCQLDCHYCNSQFRNETHFIKHMYTEHLYVNFNIDEDLDGQCSYECLYCKEMISKRSEMSQHLEMHRNETISGTEVNTTVINESSLNKLRHKVEFTYCCVFCSKRFRLPHPASEHVKYKHKTEKKSIEKKEKKPITRDTHCSLCNITFLTWRSMLNHRAKRHPETHNKDRYKNRPTYYCSTCGKAYRDRSNLNQHEETHARLTSYTCDICNKTYRTKNYIQLHLMSHRNEKNFVCDQCGRSFYSVSKLNSHSQVHQNLKLECDVCDKVFFTRYNLSKHKKTHTSDTMKKCKLCDNYFKSTNSYRTHMLLHTGIKKYACRYCDLTFAQSSGRRGHEKMRHQIA